MKLAAHLNCKDTNRDHWITFYWLRQVNNKERITIGSPNLLKKIVTMVELKDRTIFVPCTSSTGQLVALALAKASLDWIVIPFNKGLEVKKYYK